MKYTSTRNATKLYTLEEALFSGYAPDGGLFVPQELPNLLPESSKQEILSNQWKSLGYTDLATEVLHPFVGNDLISKPELRSLLQSALTGFDVPDENLVPIVPMVRTNDTSTTNSNNNRVDCYVAELFHGPTYCFKDLGMRATVFLLDYFARKKNNDSNHAAQKIVLTAATTGDTGPAAVRAVRDLDSPHLGIVVHYPEGQISNFQRKQMTCVKSDRVAIVSFEGGGDDMDRPIKNIMLGSNKNNDKNNSENVLVCGVNSYNIGRPLMQMVHFIWTYLRVVEQIERASGGEKINHDTFRLDIVIPTGAMGNIAGCYMAKQLGVPFGNLCAGVNANDITHVAFSTGKIQKPDDNEPMKASLSDAINIQLPYNMERLLFYLTGQDHDQVRTWYTQLESNEEALGAAGMIDLTESNHTEKSTVSSPERGVRTWLEKLQSEFRSARVDDVLLCDSMKQVLEIYDYFVDPHTGVAFGAAEQLGYFSKNNDHTNPVAIMATASPCKFQTAVTQALGEDKWKEYEAHHFPVRAKALIDQAEIPPTIYRAQAGNTLEENQVVWEANTRALIAKVGT